MDRRRWVLRARRGLARHWGAGVLLACGAVLRAAATVAYRPALVYIDTPRYLGHNELGLDPLGYRYLLLKPLLTLRAGLAGVAVAQHLLGLAIGVTIYALVVRHGAPRWLAAIAAAPVLLDAYQVQAEQTIMPDVLFEALLVAAVAILAWPTARQAWPTARQAWPTTRQGAVIRIASAALVLGAAATVRQVGELAVIPLLGYALAAPAIAGATARRTAAGSTSAPTTAAGPAVAAAAPWKVRGRIGLAILALGAFAVPVVGYMALSATALGTGFRLSDMDDAYLYARAAHAADCAALRVPAYERPLCPDGTALGVDALATAADSPLYAYKPPPGVARGAAISGFDTAVLTQQPLRVTEDVARDAVKVFALTRDSAPGDPPVARWQFQAAYPVYAAAQRAVPAAATARADAPLAATLRWYQLHGGFTPGPLLLALLFLGTAGAASPRTPRPLRLMAAVGTVLALATVGGADLYEFSWRYQLPALVTLPPAGVLGALALARAAVPARSPGGGRMNRCTRNRPARPSQRSGRSAAASSTPTPGSGSAATKSSDPTGPEARTPSSSGTTSP